MFRGVDMIIRDMIEDDIPELAALYRQFWNEQSDPGKMREVFSKEIQSGAYILLSAVHSGHLIGSVMGIVCCELYGNCLPFLVVEDMVVDTAAQRKGIGRALLEELEARAKAKGCSQIILVTETSRTGACRFYEAMGYNPDINKGYKKKL